MSPIATLSGNLVSPLAKPMIFVFGSNEAGRHGAGAALHARRFHGARPGQGVGLQGNSYAIPTKDGKLRTLPLAAISRYVESFLEFARSHPGLTFNVTRIGCGLAGYTDADIGPMFSAAPDNCILPEEWQWHGTRCESTSNLGGGL